MLAEGDPRHGTANGYGNLKCRCQPCRNAWAAYVRPRRAARAFREPPVHGIESSYSNWRCKCALCRDAHAFEARARHYRQTVRLIEQTEPEIVTSLRDSCGGDASLYARIMVRLAKYYVAADPRPDTPDCPDA